MNKAWQAYAGHVLDAIEKIRRICFRWADGGAHDVQVVDYH